MKKTQLKLIFVPSHFIPIIHHQKCFSFIFLRIIFLSLFGFQHPDCCRVTRSERRGESALCQPSPEPEARDQNQPIWDKPPNQPSSLTSLVG